jgi:hypothetical protein
MSKALKKDWLHKLQSRYARRNREGKTRMLNELCEDYQYERRYAIKLFRSSATTDSRKVHPGPERRYEEIQPVVQSIWLAAEQPCGKRLAPSLRPWLPHYERHFEPLSRRHRQLMRQISAATLDRLLAPARAEQVGRGRCGTKPGSLLRSEIPIRTGTWDLSRPGGSRGDVPEHSAPAEGRLQARFWGYGLSNARLGSAPARGCGKEPGRVLVARICPRRALSGSVRRPFPHCQFQVFHSFI